MLSSITKKGEIESTSAPWVVLVINVNISLVGLILLPSMFQISSTMEWRGQEDMEPFQDAKDKGLNQAQKAQDSTFFTFNDPSSHCVHRKANTIKRGCGVA